MLCCELVVNGCRGIQVIMFLNLIKTIFIIISFVFTYNQQIPKYAQQDDTTYKIYYQKLNILEILQLNTRDK